MQNANVSLAQEPYEYRGKPTPRWVIRLDGKFVISDPSQQKAAKYLEAFEANGRKFLDCYERGHPDPMKWIAHVRAKAWTFEDFSVFQILEDGSGYFRGNINEYSAAFFYRILDPSFLQQLCLAAPEVAVSH